MIKAPKYEPNQEVYYQGRKYKVFCIVRYEYCSEWLYDLSSPDVNNWVNEQNIKESEIFDESPEKFPMLSWVYYRNKKCRITGRYIPEKDGSRDYQFEDKEGKHYKAKECELSYRHPILDISLALFVRNRQYTKKWQIGGVTR